MRNCGVTNEPSIEEVARKLVSEPDRFYSLAGSVDAYIGVSLSYIFVWIRFCRWVVLTISSSSDPAPDRGKLEQDPCAASFGDEAVRILARI